MKKSPFTECNNTLYIQAKRSGIHPLCLAIDGIPVTSFKGSKAVFLEIDDAIKWHENEITCTKGKWSDKVLNVLLKAKQDFKSEKVNYIE